MQIAVIGTTTWGTTLGVILSRRGLSVQMWSRREEEARLLRLERENSRFLSGITFPESLTVTSSVEEALDEAQIVIFAVPAASLRHNARSIAKAINSRSVVLSATKGMEKNTGKRMSQVLMEELPSKMHDMISVLSGPNLALEIIQGKPASTVVAAVDVAVAMKAQEILMSPLFRVYTNTDVVGVELAGSLKNIIALGAGVCDGLGYGDNAKAAFITRGLVEITRLGVAAGASPLTFSGLAGLGDLLATCASTRSRNRYVGEQLAMGLTLKEVLASMINVAEGVDTTVAALNMALELDIYMPITRVIYRILFDGFDPKEAASELMVRAPKSESIESC